ncbi:HD domain-containing protein [Colwelliaceae bacterium 6471]
MHYKSLLDAISFATRVHHGQTRADDSTPYVSHPFRVMTILSHVFGVTDESILITAILHDTIEDTSADYDSIAALFGSDIAQNVAKLTKDMRLPKSLREEKFLADFDDLDDGIKLCKLGDMLDNLIDTDTIDDKKIVRIVSKAKNILARLQPGDEKRPIQEAIKEVQTKLDTMD